jgi:hypothetical protein
MSDEDIAVLRNKYVKGISVGRDNLEKFSGIVDDTRKIVDALNPLVVVSDKVNLDSFDYPYLITAQKPCFINGGPADLTVTQSENPLSIEAFYSIRLLNQADGSLEDQVRNDSSGSRRYFFRDADGVHRLYEKKDGQYLLLLDYSSLELKNQGEGFRSEFDSLAELVKSHVR